MFGAEKFAQYKKRLANVRAELVNIDEELSTLPTNDLEQSKSLTTVALCAARIARILVRVIDSLPG